MMASSERKARGPLDGAASSWNSNMAFFSFYARYLGLVSAMSLASRARIQSGSHPSGFQLEPEADSNHRRFSQPPTAGQRAPLVQTSVLALGRNSVKIVHRTRRSGRGSPVWRDVVGLSLRNPGTHARIMWCLSD